MILSMATGIKFLCGCLGCCIEVLLQATDLVFSLRSIRVLNRALFKMDLGTRKSAGRRTSVSVRSPFTNGSLTRHDKRAFNRNRKGGASNSNLYIILSHANVTWHTTLNKTPFYFCVLRAVLYLTAPMSSRVRERSDRTERLVRQSADLPVMGRSFDGLCIGESLCEERYPQNGQ